MDPNTCPECDGTGEVERYCGHAPEYPGGPVLPCHEAAECESCQGSGEVWHDATERDLRAARII